MLTPQLAKKKGIWDTTVEKAGHVDQTITTKSCIESVIFFIQDSEAEVKSLGVQSVKLKATQPNNYGKFLKANPEKFNQPKFNTASNNETSNHSHCY